MDSKLIYKDEAYQIIGAAMAVHRELGQGFLEAVYQEALEIEFESIQLPFEQEKSISISFKGRTLTKCYFADFVCFGKIIVELKALSGITPDHRAQVINYLKATGMKLGLLINFGASSLQYERIIK